MTEGKSAVDGVLMLCVANFLRDSECPLVYNSKICIVANFDPSLSLKVEALRRVFTKPSGRLMERDILRFAYIQQSEECKLATTDASPDLEEMLAG